MPKLLSARLLVLVFLTSVSATLFACGSSTKATCQGDERCDCYPNKTCNPGLTCMSNMCVAVQPAGGGGAPGSTGGTTLVSPLGTGGVVVPAAGGSTGALDAGTLPPSAGGATGAGGVVVPPPGTGGAVTGSGGSPAVDASAGGPNLVKNGDFSSGKLYWDLTLQAGDVGGASYSTGQYCVSNESSSLYLSFSLGYPSSPSDAFAVEAGATYTFSYQVSGYGLIQAKIGGAVTPYTAVTAFSDTAASSALRTVTHVVTPTVSVAQAGLVFNGTLDYLEVVCFDNVSFVKN